MTVKSDKLESLPNIGKVIAAKLRKIGIHDVGQFLEGDPYEIFDQLLSEVDPTLCRCALSSVVGAHHGVRWNLLHKQAAAKFTKRYPHHQWNNDC